MRKAAGIIEKFGFTAAELALMCASHSSEPAQVEAVLAMLAKLGLTEDSLICGGHPALGDAVNKDWAATGYIPTAACNTCAGKHVGVLATAIALGYSTEGYENLVRLSTLSHQQHFHKPPLMTAMLKWPAFLLNMIMVLQKEHYVSIPIQVTATLITIFKPMDMAITLMLLLCRDFVLRKKYQRGKEEALYLVWTMINRRGVLPALL